MAFLVAAVVLVGLLVVLDLVLTFGVIRRLREHTALLSERSAPMPDLILGAGQTVGAFTATSVTGATLSNTDLASGTLVGFFSPGCSACEVELPRFVKLAGAHPGGAERVLAAVIGEGSGDGSGDKYVDTLKSVAAVVTVPHGHELETAFRVRGFPSFARIGERQAIEAGGSLADLAPATS
jgi:thiol-disulfide isomerase/thioredoxin